MEVDNDDSDPTSSSPVEELEEGEIAPGDVPEPRWDDVFKVPYGFAKDFVKSYLEDPSLANKEQFLVDDSGQMLHTEGLHVRKEFVPTPFLLFHCQIGKRLSSVQKNVFTIEWSFDDLKSFNANFYPIPPRAQDNVYVADMVIPSRQVGDLRFVASLKPDLFWDFIVDKNAPSYDTVIQSWVYDDEIRLFVLKRRDGCQYLSVRHRHFRSLSADDLVEIGKRKLINPGNNQFAAAFGKRLYQDYRSRFTDEFDVKKLFIQPRKKMKITRADGSIDRIQKPIECMSTVPAKKLKQNILSNLDNWEIDKNTGFAMMYGDKDKTKLLFSIYDPMQLVNLSRSDLRKLDDTASSCIPFWKIEEDRYRKIIRKCLRERIHANSTRFQEIEEN